MHDSALWTETGVAYDLVLHGDVDWDGSTLVGPASGLRFEGATGCVRGGGVLLSASTGLELVGDLGMLAFESFFVDSSGTDGVTFSGATALVMGLIVENSMEEDVVLIGGSSGELRDSHFDESKVTLDQDSELRRTWSTRFLSVDAEGEPIGDVMIAVFDADGGEVGSVVTDSAGFSEELVLHEFVQIGADRAAKTPHTLEVESAAFDTTITYLADSLRVVSIVLPEPVSALPGLSIPVPSALALGPPAPNPFHPRTRIEFELPHPSGVRIDVYSSAGRLVRRMLDDELPAGRHVMTWDGLDDHRRHAASGVYFLRLESGDRGLSQRVVLAR